MNLCVLKSVLISVGIKSSSSEDIPVSDEGPTGEPGRGVEPGKGVLGGEGGMRAASVGRKPIK